tara:strand:- start:1053 stop:1316 length:264 start_codon:yes stop_codon:yes gene_type:complete
MKIINGLPIYSLHFSKLIEREELIRDNSKKLESPIKIISEKLFLLPIDWHLPYVLNKHCISTFWSRLASFSQVSESIFKSNRDFRNS